MEEPLVVDVGDLDSEASFDLAAFDAALAADASPIQRPSSTSPPPLPPSDASFPSLAFPSPPPTPSGTEDGAPSSDATPVQSLPVALVAPPLLPTVAGFGASFGANAGGRDADGGALRARNLHDDDDKVWGKDVVRARAYLALHHQVYLWLEAVARPAGVRLVSPSLFVSLHDGLVLTEVAYRFNPRLVESTKIVVAPKSRKARRRNIKVFLRFCLALGLPATSLFHVDDLYLRRDLERVVRSLARVAAAFTAKGFYPAFVRKHPEDFIFPRPALDAAARYLAQVDVHRRDLELGRSYTAARAARRSARSPRSASPAANPDADSDMLHRLATDTRARINAARESTKASKKLMIRRTETEATLLTTPLPPPPGPLPAVSLLAAASQSFAPLPTPSFVDTYHLPLLDAPGLFPSASAPMLDNNALSPFDTFDASAPGMLDAAPVTGDDSASHTHSSAYNDSAEGAYVVAVHAFDAEYESQLSIVPGLKLGVVDLEPIDGWISVMLLHHPFTDGYVPVDYVSPIIGLLDDPPSSSAASSASSASSTGSPAAHRSRLEAKLAAMGFAHSIAADPSIEHVYGIRTEIEHYAASLVPRHDHPRPSASPSSSAEHSLDDSLILLDPPSGAPSPPASDAGTAESDSLHIISASDDAPARGAAPVASQGDDVNDDDDILLDTDGNVIDDEALLAMEFDLDDIDLDGLSDIATEDEDLGLV